MAIHTYQCAGEYLPKDEIIPKDRHIKKIHKLGIQAREGAQFKLDNTVFQIGKAGVLNFEDAQINSIMVENYSKEFAIIDFTYSDYEE